MDNDLTPLQIVKELDKYIVGQDDAKKAVAIALRNRIRRKKLTSSLQAFCLKETIAKALADLNLNPNSRPEELAFDRFLELFKRLKKSLKSSIILK